VIGNSPSGVSARRGQAWDWRTPAFDWLAERVDRKNSSKPREAFWVVEAQRPWGEATFAFSPGYVERADLQLVLVGHRVVPDDELVTE
jgi:hypothetical protein